MLIGVIGRRFSAGPERDAALEEIDDEPDIVAEEWIEPTEAPEVGQSRVRPPPLPRRAASAPTVTDDDDAESVTNEYRLAIHGTDATEYSGPLPSIAPTRAVPDFGEYDVIAEVGSGGMGRVYKARDRRLGRVVAIKTVLTGQTPSPAAVERFRGEARAAAQLDHPGIVPVFEFKEHAGLYFFTMAFVEGRSLAARLNEGPLEAVQAAFIVQHAAEATDFAPQAPHRPSRHQAWQHHDRPGRHRAQLPTSVWRVSSIRPTFPMIRPVISHSSRLITRCIG